MAVDSTARALALAASNTLQPISKQRPAHATLLTAFQEGHGWVQSGNPAVFLPNDSKDNVIGTQCVTVQTNALGGIARVERVGLDLDLIHKCLRVLLEVDHPDDVAKFFLYAGSGGWQDSVVKGLGGPPNLVPGVPQWVTLPFCPVTVQGSPDLAAVDRLRFSLRARSGAKVTLRLHAIEVVDDMGATFPKGVISFTWDDGRVEQYTRAKPILDRYLFPATAYVIADQIASTEGYFMSLSNLHRLQDVSGWEIACHAATLAMHEATLEGLTESELQAEFSAVKRWLLQNGFHGGDQLAWPKSRYDETALRVADRYFATARTVSTMSWYHNALPPEPRLHLGSKELGLGTSLEEAKANVDMCRSARTWLVFTGHALADRAIDGSTWSESDFRTLIDYVRESEIPVLTVGDVVSARA